MSTHALTEIMLHAEIFCTQVEGTMPKSICTKHEELRDRIEQCREVLAYLQGLYEDGNLAIDYRSVPEAFRHLVKSLMWVAFHRRRKLDFEIFRDLVHMQETLTSLLVDHIRSEARL